jgi:hypothetical protein
MVVDPLQYLPEMELLIQAAVGADLIKTLQVV